MIYRFLTTVSNNPRKGRERERENKVEVEFFLSSFSTFFDLALSLSLENGSPLAFASPPLSSSPPRYRPRIPFSTLSKTEMATRGAANRGGGPTTFVGAVRKWELHWDEAELPSYGLGLAASGASGCSRRIRMLRWVRNGEL